MKKIADYITKHSLLIVIISILLLIPAGIGYFNTRINYDILSYLPSDIETIEGQNILTDKFGIGGFAFVMTDDLNSKNILEFEEKIKQIDHVNQVVSIADITDTTIPIEMLPNEVIDKITSGNETIIFVTFDTGTSEETTINAVSELRTLVSDQNKVQSMTGMVLDTRNLSEKEIVAYVILAVIFCILVLMIATDSYIIPLFLLGNIGFAIIYNMGSNIIFGEISYITKAITAVLQLGVTMDFSIFLYHKFEQKKQEYSNKQEAMSEAIQDTFKSVLGSSLTTIAGFLSLCAMDLTLGTDIGLVMAKGVLWGLVCVIILLPALLLVFDKVIEKTKHKLIFPKFKGIQNLVIKYYKIIIIVFALIAIPAIIGNHNVGVYYKLDNSLPDTLPCRISSKELMDKYNIVSPQIILINNDIKLNDLKNLTDELKNIDGVDLVLAPGEIEALGISDEIIPEEIKDIYKNDDYQLIILNSTYEVASDELNEQIDVMNKIVKNYDQKSIIAGEGALTKDLVEIADHDFRIVNYLSIIIIFLLMLFVLKSGSLPFILVVTIELAIFSNMAIAYYTNTTLPFIASIVVGTIQLGATIDYAILMSTTYLDNRLKIKDKYKAIKDTLEKCVPSIIVSALCFFAATFGVALYSQIDMIGSICNLLSRGAIISMIVVTLLLPSLLIIFDKLIMKTTKGMKGC